MQPYVTVPFWMSRESNSCAECYASSGFVFIISFIRYTKYGWLGTIRLAGWQGIYLVTFQNRDSKLCTPLTGNGNPSDAGNYINGINRKVKEQWTSKKKLCNVLIQRTTRVTRTKKHTYFLLGLKLNNINSTWKIKIDQNCATPYNTARSCSKPKKRTSQNLPMRRLST